MTVYTLKIRCSGVLFSFLATSDLQKNTVITFSFCSLIVLINHQNELDLQGLSTTAQQHFT